MSRCKCATACWSSVASGATARRARTRRHTARWVSLEGQIYNKGGRAGGGRRIERKSEWWPSPLTVVVFIFHFESQERSYGFFSRSMRLPENADSSKVEAKLEHGVLTVQVAKVPEPEPQVVDVPVV
jgi:hypothetical protein